MIKWTAVLGIGFCVIGASYAAQAAPKQMMTCSFDREEVKGAPGKSCTASFSADCGLERLGDKACAYSLTVACDGHEVYSGTAFPVGVNLGGTQNFAVGLVSALPGPTTPGYPSITVDGNFLQLILPFVGADARLRLGPDGELIRGTCDHPVT
jgi:hypothetical protein